MSSNSLQFKGLQRASIKTVLNTEPEPRNADEQILQTVNEIYFTLRDNDYEHISYEDSKMLAYIAHLCPLAAGPAVYQARDMYALINDTLQYSDSTVCAFEGYFRESANTLYPALTKKEKHLNYFKAQPNPASERVLFTFKANDASSDLTIYNLSGNIIYSAVLSANTNQLSIDISNFAKGVYIAHFVNTKTSSRIKFIVNK